MTMESVMDRSSRASPMEFSPKDSYSSLMADQQGDSSFSEDVESPRSPPGGRRRTQWRKAIEDRKDRCYMHSQVLRIKEEESQIGADFISDYCFDGFVADSYPFDDRTVFWSRTILPASPLSGGRSIKTNEQFGYRNRA